MMRTPMSRNRSDANAFPGRLLSAGVVLLCLSGCSGNTPEPAVETVPESRQPANTSDPAVDPERPETKWIGKIPYDVFFDQPLTVATDTTPIGGRPASELAAVSPAGNDNAPPAQQASIPASSPPDTPAQPAAAATSQATGAPNWQEILPMDTLVEELKQVRTRLMANLNTVATFNKSTASISLDGAMLVALAAVALQHPEDVSWKDKAPAIRDLSYQIYENADGSGREPFGKTKEPFEQVTNLLDGGAVPDGSSTEALPFGEVVYAADMMKRIEIAFNFLKSNINTESRFKEDPQTVERELRILAALGTIITDGSYDSTDEAAYQKLASQLVQGAMGGVTAVKTGSYPDFQAALNQAQNSCAECHNQYRGSSSGF